MADFSGFVSRIDVSSFDSMLIVSQRPGRIVCRNVSRWHSDMSGVAVYHHQRVRVGASTR
jgi:hypothetical protein